VVITASGVLVVDALIEKLLSFVAWELTTSVLIGLLMAAFIAGAVIATGLLTTLDAFF
jgi:hypothetical protein